METLLEIVELESGELAIQRVESDDEPLMIVAFSDELRDALDEKCIEVGRMMLTAGVHMLAEAGHNLSGKTETASVPRPTLH